MSGQRTGDTYDIRGYTDDAVTIGVANETLLREFVRSGLSDHDQLAAARAAIVEELGTEQLIDAAAVAGNFECMNRIADACGISVDKPMLERAVGALDELNMNHFASAKNTLG